VIEVYLDEPEPGGEPELQGYIQRLPDLILNRPASMHDPARPLQPQVTPSRAGTSLRLAIGGGRLHEADPVR
jgi:hypothetical protein